MSRRADDELLNREIDGENTAEESATLGARVARDPAMRASHQRLMTLAQVLRNVREVEPPAELAEDVIRSVRDRPRPAARQPRRIDALSSALTKASRPRPVLIFVSGLAAGVVFAAVLGRSLALPLQERSEVAGTVLPGNRLGHLGTIVGHERFEFEGGRGEATTRRGKDVVLVEIQVDSARTIDLSVDFDASTFTPLAFERSGGTNGGIAVGAGSVSFRHAGEGRCSLVLGVSQASSSRLRLKIGSDGSTLEKTLETRAEPTNFPDS